MFFSRWPSANIRRVRDVNRSNPRRQGPAWYALYEIHTTLLSLPITFPSQPATPRPDVHCVGPSLPGPASSALLGSPPPPPPYSSGPCAGARALAQDVPMNHVLHMHDHSSLTLEVIRGVMLCNVCGSFGTVNTRGLSKECPPSRRPTKTGAEVLSRLSRGLTPKSGVPWPQP